MKVFEYEAKAGLTEAIEANASIAFTTSARTAFKKDADVDFDTTVKLWDNENIKTQLAQANANPNQIDLHYIDCILASTGWNKNDDVFSLGDTWSAKDTPVDKKFDFQHDEADIIGHITSCMILDKEGNIYSEAEQPAFDYDIVIGTVLYKYWRDDNLQERMNQIIAEIPEDKWFVSMECMFRGFDYALVSPEGENIIVARNEDTAFLTKHLRSYGGEGVFKDYKIGRLLRNFTFSGNGLVDKPANPDSIIFNRTSPFQTDAVLVQWENNMNDDNAKLETQLSDAHAEIAKLKADADAAAQAKFDKEVTLIKAELDGMQAKVDEAMANISAKDETIAELNKTIDEINVKLTEAVEQNENMKAEASKALRMQKLVDIVDEAKAEELVNKFTAVDDGVFDELVVAYKKADAAKENPFKKDDEEKDDEKDSKANDSDDSDDTDANEDNADADLDNVKDEETGIAGAVDNNKDKAVFDSAVAFIRETLTKK